MIFFKCIYFLFFDDEFYFLETLLIKVIAMVPHKIYGYCYWVFKNLQMGPFGIKVEIFRKCFPKFQRCLFEFSILPIYTLFTLFFLSHCAGCGRSSRGEGGGYNCNEELRERIRYITWCSVFWLRECIKQRTWCSVFFCNSKQIYWDWIDYSKHKECLKQPIKIYNRW